MQKKENTPMREIRRRYEERNKEKRKETNGHFATFIPRADFEEMNAFLKRHNLTKVMLVYEGYISLKEKYEPHGCEQKSEGIREENVDLHKT